MSVLVDTDIWSEAFRKKGGQYSREVHELRRLIEEDEIEMIGIIRMEILCGIRDQDVFERFRSRLSAFIDRPLTSEVYEMAAQFFNLCRSKGIQGSNNDFLICACSVKWEIPIYSKDRDYLHYAKYLPIELYEPS